MTSYGSILVLLTFALGCTAQSICKSPTPASPFDYQKYMGLWYEIGKIQTPGGARFQANCVCTLSGHTPTETPGAAESDTTVIYACREKTPTGPWLNTTAILTDMNPPGVWLETFFPYTPIEFEVDYYVIDMDDEGTEYAMEYDCSETDYCVHIFARQPFLEEDRLRGLVEKAVQMGLNPLNLPLKLTDHKGCW